MTRKLKQILIGLAALAALALGGAALAGASNDASASIPAAAKAKAEQAALAATHGGKVNQSELDNENGATYEVEVARTDGSQVDVRLDDNYKVVVIEPDGEGKERPNDNGAG